MPKDKYEETELIDLGLPHYVITSWDTDKRTVVSLQFYLTGKYHKGDIAVDYHKKLTTNLPNFTYTNPNLPPSDSNQGDYSTNETTGSYENIGPEIRDL